MKTLVIHLDDRSTDFLKEIYKRKDYTVMNDWKEMSLESIIEAIKNHDRIMMMGHGCPYGLLGLTDIFMKDEFIQLLKTKECVCIWCNADVYVQREGIKGFYSGMFISEVGEAQCNNINIPQDDVTYSNYFFANLMNVFIDSPDILTEVKKGYIDDLNPVIKFNNDRLYYGNGTYEKINKENLIVT